MKFDKEVWMEKRRKVPKGTYMLMVFMGIYMCYLISRVVDGLSEPDVSAKLLVYVGIAFLGIASISFIAIGMSSLVKRDYREAYPEDEETEADEIEEENEK